ncbi:MAG: glycosyltransferase, partial [Bacteroidetes bacterium]
RIPATTFIERLIEGLAEARVEVLLFGEVVGPVNYTSPKVRVLGWRGRYGRWVSLLRYLLLFLVRRPGELSRLWRRLDPGDWSMAAWQLSKFLPVLWHSPDVFHLQWAKSIKDWHWVTDFGMKLVVSLRGGQINWEPLVDPSVADLYRSHLPSVDGFHAVSHAIECEASQYGASAVKIHVVYSGLNLEQFPFVPEKSDRVKLEIISVGRPHWKKGYTYALDAFQLLKGKIDFHYTIIGGFCQEHAFHVHDAGLMDQVTLIGATPSKEVLRYIQQADLLLLPSVEEGIANVVLEAMALGTPVICTDCGGMAEVIEDDVNGFLVPTRDAQALAEALMRFAALSPEERNRLALAARQTIEQRFHQKQMVDKMIALYREVMGKGGLDGAMNYKKEGVSQVSP